MNNTTALSQTTRITDTIDQLATFTEPERPHTRLVFSSEFEQARLWLRETFVAAGLSCHVDAGGNLVGVLKARTDEPCPDKVLLGSHIDTVPAGGRFDGIAGVAAALEVVHYLNTNEIKLPFDLEIVDYLGEELNVWGTSCLGSRHMAGLITSEMLERVDPDGRKLGTEIARIGGSGGASEEPRSDASQIIACLELHIEQAKSLEKQNLDVGIVTSIPGIYRYSISITGQAGHSGTTTMTERRDALVAAADIIQGVSAIANQIAGADNQHFAATIGKIDVFPNGAAIVPGQVEATLDLRAASDHSRLNFFAEFENLCTQASKSRNCEINIKQLAAAAAAPMNDELMNLLATAAVKTGVSATKISGGAGHDTAHLSRFAPAGMIFIPCRDGLSHCPEEFTTSEAIAKGSLVLIGCVLELAKRTSLTRA